jgi:hypothetical protein
MSANGTRTIIWQGGEDAFCLAKVGLIFDLEEKCRAGIGLIYARLASGSYFLNDVRETIRLGLIGGGMPRLKRRWRRSRTTSTPTKTGWHRASWSRSRCSKRCWSACRTTPWEKGAGGGARNRLYHDDGRLRRSEVLGIGGAFKWPPERPSNRRSGK